MFAVSTSTLCYLISIFSDSPSSQNLMPLFALFHRPLAGTGHCWSLAAPAAGELDQALDFVESHPKAFISNSSCCEAGSLRILCEFLIGFGFSTLRSCHPMLPLCLPIHAFCFSCLAALARVFKLYSALSGILAFLQTERSQSFSLECDARCGLPTFVLYHVGVIFF